MPARPAERSSTLAICGAGNGGHALTVVASAHITGAVLWLTSTEERAARLRERALAPDGLRATGVVSGSAHRLRLISADPAAVIPSADLVLLVLPAFAHAPVLKRVAPYLKEDALLVAMPSRSGLEFDLSLLPVRSETRRRVVCGLQTLPWTARVRDPGRLVEVKGAKSWVSAAALPPHGAGNVAPELTRLLGTRIVPLGSFLDLTLGNPGQVIHPAGMYGLFGDRERTYREAEIPQFYGDLPDHAAAVMEAISREIAALARLMRDASGGTLPVTGVQPIGEWVRQSYGSQIADASTLGACFRSNAAYRGIMAPMRGVAPGEWRPDFQHRFLSDDVPYGLAVVKAIAEILDAPTPTIAEVIDWAQEKLGKEYLVAGRLRGRDASELRIPQNAGITSPDALVRFYL
jgi:hypothetical protein